MTGWGPCTQRCEKRKKEAAWGIFSSSSKKSQPQAQPPSTFKTLGLLKERAGWLRHCQPGTEHRLVRTEPHLQGNHNHSRPQQQAALRPSSPPRPALQPGELLLSLWGWGTAAAGVMQLGADLAAKLSRGWGAKPGSEPRMVGTASPSVPRNRRATKPRAWCSVMSSL